MMDRNNTYVNQKTFSATHSIMSTNNSTALDDLSFCNSVICGLGAFIIGVIGIACFFLSFVVCCVAHYRRSRPNSSFVVSEAKNVSSIENGKENPSTDYGSDVFNANQEPQYEEIGRYDKDPTHQTASKMSKKTFEYDYVDVIDMKGELRRQMIWNSHERCYINKQFADDNGTNDTAIGMANKLYDNSNLSCDKSTTGISVDNNQNGKGNKKRDQLITEMNQKLAQKTIPCNSFQTKDNINDNGDTSSETEPEYEDAFSSSWNILSTNNDFDLKTQACNNRGKRCNPGNCHPTTLLNVQSISMVSLPICHHSGSNDKGESGTSATYERGSTESLNCRHSSDSSLSDDPYMNMKSHHIHQDKGVIHVNFHVIKNLTVNKK